MSAVYRQPAVADLEEVLRWISPDCARDAWGRFLMAVTSTPGDAGRDIAENWSAKADSYNPRDFRDTWRSIRAGGCITAASLIRMVREAGGKSGGATKPPQRHTQKPVERVQELPRTLALARAIWQRVAREDGHVAAHPYFIRKGISNAAGAGRTIASSPRIRKAQLIDIKLIGPDPREPAA